MFTHYRWRERVTGSATSCRSELRADFPLVTRLPRRPDSCCPVISSSSYSTRDTQLLDTDGPFRTAVSDFVSIFGPHRTPQMTARVLHQYHSTDLAFYNFNSSKQDPNQHVTMSPACLPHHHMSNNITPRGEITFFLDKFMIL